MLSWRLNQTITMRTFKTITSLATFLLLSIMEFSFSSCSNDEDEKENPTSSLQPFVGYWQYLDEDEEYHSIITITEGGNYQFRYQDGENIGTDGGMVSFDKKSSTMTFSPTFNNGTDTKDSEYQYAIRSISDSRLQIVDEDGNSITYEKISDGTFNQHYDWGKSLVGGTWKIYVKNTSDEILYTRIYTFFEGGTYSYWTENYGIYRDGTFKFDKRSITLDDEKADIVTFTSNSLKFTLDGEIYSGTRIVQKDKQLVESNKRLLVGTWSCVVATYYGNEKPMLTLKSNGEYECIYEDQDCYKGSYYVSEDKIFFENAMGKDPIGGEHQIEELTSKGFVLSDLYGNGEITGTKTK